MLYYCIKIQLFAFNLKRMISIGMEDFMQWFQGRMDSKYAMKMQSLKPDQVIVLYNCIRIKMDKHTDKEQHNDIMVLLNRSLLIITRIMDKLPICLDSNFCDRFIRTFDFQINLLCTLYHSLNHFQLINKQSKFEKEKIVEGINKMYTIHVKIKELYKHNPDVSQTLLLIKDYKLIFSNKIKSITDKLALRRNSQPHPTHDFEAQAIDFYEGLIDKVHTINQQPEAKKSLMRVYFQLMHQLYSAQAQLQLYLQQAIKVSTQLKGRKKNISFVGQESSNQLMRWINVILKPSISLKQLKKLKVQQFVKTIATVLQEKDTYNYLYMEQFDSNQEDILSLTNLIIDIAREMDKIETSGLLSLISEYRDSLMPTGSNKFIHRLIEYQNDMSRFYSLHEETKQLQKYVQSIVLEELGEKVNIIIDQNQELNLPQQRSSKMQSIQ